MTRDEAIKAYEERFGGFPSYLLMGAPDDVIVWKVRRALRLNREIEPDESDGDY